MEKVSENEKCILNGDKYGWWIRLLFNLIYVTNQDLTFKEQYAENGKIMEAKKKQKKNKYEALILKW